MQIDIIAYTDTQFAALTDEQIQEVRSAQAKKNALFRALQKAIEREKYRFTENGTFISKLWELKTQELTAEYESEVEALREELLFYLRYSGKPTSPAPYPMDYSLSDLERYDVVRTYYTNTYTDPIQRFSVFAEDVHARAYLGEHYALMYDSFRLDAEDATSA